MDIVADSLLNKEARRKEKGIKVQYEANFVDNCRRSENRGANKGCDQSRGKSKSRMKLVCQHSGKQHHKKSDYRYYKETRRLQKLSQIRLNTRRKKIISIEHMIIVLGLLTRVLPFMSLHMNIFCHLPKVVILVRSR